MTPTPETPAGRPCCTDSPGGCYNHPLPTPPGFHYKAQMIQRVIDALTATEDGDRT